MKKTIAILLVSILALGLFAGCSNEKASQQSPLPVLDEATGGVTEAIPTLTVQGKGELTRTPDMATIQFGLNVYDKASAKEATDEAGKTMHAVAKALEGFGVKEEDMKTSQFSIYETYKYDSNGNRTGKALYCASNTLSVDIYDLDTLAEIIDAGIAAGATNTYGISFGLKDFATGEEEALALAFENAYARGSALAQAAGKKLGDVVLLGDGTQMSEQIYTQNDTRSYALAEDAAAGGGSYIAPGSLKITAQVSVRFIME